MNKGKENHSGSSGHGLGPSVQGASDETGSEREPQEMSRTQESVLVCRGAGSAADQEVTNCLSTDLTEEPEEVVTIIR